MKNSFERGKEAYETLKIGKFRDCIRVTEIYHTQHKNAKYGTYAKFKSEKKALNVLLRLCCIKESKSINIMISDVLYVAFKTPDGIKDIFEMDGAKIEYKGELYHLPKLSIEI